MDNVTVIPGPAGAPYSSAVRAGDTVYLAGAIGRDPTTGGLAGTIEAETDQCLRNLAETLKQAGGSLADVVTTTVFLTHFERDYKAYNDVWRRHFGDHLPARATVDVKGLAMGALIEIQGIAVVSHSR